MSTFLVERRGNTWVALYGDRSVGSLTVNAANTITLVLVDVAWRRLGVASRLYAAASAEETIYHDCAAHCSPAGWVWSQQVGGPRVPDCTCCPPTIVTYATLPVTYDGRYRCDGRHWDTIRQLEAARPGGRVMTDEDGMCLLVPYIHPTGGL